MKKSLVCLLLVLAQTSVFAQARFANVFNNGAVLQRQKPLNIWGFGKSGEAVTVKLDKAQKTAVCDATGKWKVTFAAQEAGGPYVLELLSSGKSVKLNDIYLGDVWLCSGQSNMEWTVGQSENASSEISNAKFPFIRQFKVKKSVELSPKTDVDNANWTFATSSSVSDFTAVGYFFARKLYQDNDGVAIGLINSSWGGSQVESWIPKDDLAAQTEFVEVAKKLPLDWSAADKLYDAKFKKDLLKGAAVPTEAEEKLYYNMKAAPTTWAKLDVASGSWEWRGFMSFRGNAYMAKLVDLPANFAAEATTLKLGKNNSNNQVYINGKLIYEGKTVGVKELNLPAGTWKSGTNFLVIKFGQMVDPEWFGVGLDGSEKDFAVVSPGQTINIYRSWYGIPSFADAYSYNHGPNNHATTLYNGMIAPITDLSIKGAIWYQGESNAGRAEQYTRSFPLMINSWRSKFKDEFPFYFVQLTAYGPENDANTGSDWAELREAQTKTLSLPKTGMAVILDVGNPKDIHPLNKQTVGYRLALLANHTQADRPNVYEGPVYKSASFANGKAVISFKANDTKLYAKEKYGYLKGFEIAGEDRKFYFARAEIVGNQVIVSSPEVAEPKAVRYAWSNSPIDANLFGTGDIPCGTFRTDDWDGITKGKKFE